MSLRNNNGTTNVRVVLGASWTGNQAPDGALYVVEATIATKGLNHPCGATWVTYTATPVTKAQAPDGSLYVTTTGATGAMKVTNL